MSEKYDVKVSIEAEKDLQNIIIYIKDKLKEPEIARRHTGLMRKEIKSLEYFPQRYAIIDNERIKKFKFRKLIIKNYIAFYRIDEEKKAVNVERVIYGASDWIYEL